ncbi:phage tail protein [Enterobacter huaxiensis]|uniref:phage tail protein n=1 Tax=Enterobacter huaxiensis TaxID=2494702 RepID=UPI002175C78F|nr:phage tail protein [Enterobacter huaxiensis]MCS5452493.1 phage tail protein [Enterobacter huaxiensis]
MALKEFTWCPRINASAEIVHRSRTTQFGDGYSQSVGDGLNSRSQKWDLEFVGNEKTISDIAAFLDEHAGIKSFLYKAPLNPKSLFRASTYKVTALGNKNYSLSVAFTQAFTSTTPFTPVKLP